MSTEQPPQSTDNSLAAYLVRMFNGVDNAVLNNNKMAVKKLLPPKPVVGTLYYFSQSIPPTITDGEGLYIYKSTGYVFLG